MMTELLEKILKTQERIDKKLTALLNQKPEVINKEATWVKVSFIIDITGWDKRKLFEARKQNIIQWRKTKEKGFEYCVESIPDQFLLKKAC